MSEKPQIVRVLIPHPYVEDVPCQPIRVVVAASEPQPEPKRIVAAAGIVGNQSPPVAKRIAVLEADPDPERYDIRTKWLWLHQAVVAQRERVQRKGDASARRDLDMLEDMKEDYRRLVKLVTGKPA